jgi:leucyl aminopeptidase
MCRKCCRRKGILPSDIIHSYSGTSIEIIDTDAEGRLVLADGISYMIKKLQTRIYCRYRYLPVVVLVHGYECGALFTNNETPSKNYKMQEIQ